MMVKLSWNMCHVCIILVLFRFRRRREKLHAHLKESRSLKNYTANSSNALDGKTRTSNTNLQMHEVTADVFLCFSFKNA